MSKKINLIIFVVLIFSLITITLFLVTRAEDDSKKGKDIKVNHWGTVLDIFQEEDAIYLSNGEDLKYALIENSHYGFDTRYLEGYFEYMQNSYLMISYEMDGSASASAVHVFRLNPDKTIDKLSDKYDNEIKCGLPRFSEGMLYYPISDDCEWGIGVKESPALPIGDLTVRAVLKPLE